MLGMAAASTMAKQKTSTAPDDVVTDGLLLYLDVGNTISYPGIGSTIFDLSPSGYDGTINGGVVYSSNNDGIFNFDGELGSYIDLGVAAAIGSSLTGLTVEMFVKPLVAEAAMYLENGTTFTTNTFYLAQENATEWSFEVYGVAHNIVYQEYTLDAWQHLACTWEPDVAVDLYLNGALGDSRRWGDGSIQTSLRDGTTNLSLGQRPGPAIPVNSDIAIVRIYDRVLTSAEVLQNYNAGRTRFGL